MIKFRAWIYKRERMCDVIGIDWISSTKDIVTIYDNLIETGEPLEFPVEGSLMQYTGKDKNGKEAFTKDIFKDNVGNIGIIEWDYSLLARLEEIDYEIIGNTMENPELLKNE